MNKYGKIQHDVSDLWDGVVDVNPARTGVDVQVSWLLIGQGVGDGGVAALVVIVCRRSKETGSNRSVLPQEVWGETDCQADMKMMLEVIYN